MKKRNPEEIATEIFTYALEQDRAMSVSYIEGVKRIDRLIQESLRELLEVDENMFGEISAELGIAVNKEEQDEED